MPLWLSSDQIRIFIGVAAEEGVEVFDAAEIGADGDVFDGAAVGIGSFGLVPGAAVLLPGDLAGGRGQVDVHVSAFKFEECGHGEPLESFLPNSAIHEL